MYFRVTLASAILMTAFGLAAGAHAQMAITTFGATDALLCYQNAADDFSGDISPCDAALSQGGTSPADRYKTLVNRGIIKNRTGDIASAMDDFNAALAINEKIAEAYLNRGNSHYLSGRYSEALSDYETAISYEVNKPWAAWYNIGLAHEAMKETEKARAAYMKALEINPEFSAAQEKLARLGTG